MRCQHRLLSRTPGDGPDYRSAPLPRGRLGFTQYTDSGPKLLRKTSLYPLDSIEEH